MSEPPLNWQRMMLLWRHLQNFFEPVSAFAESCHIAGRWCARHTCLLEVLLVLGRIHHLNKIILYRLAGVLARIGNLGCVPPARLGGNDDYAISTFRTIDGGRGGVLEDFDGSYFGRIEVFNAAGTNAVDDEQRIGVPVGTCATDPDIQAGPGCPEVGSINTPAVRPCKAWSMRVLETVES